MRDGRPGSAGTRYRTLGGAQAVAICGAQSDTNLHTEKHAMGLMQVDTKECQSHMNVRKASTARDHAGPAGHLTRPRLVTTGSAREPSSTPTG
jgi:hypothetical protein